MTRREQDERAIEMLRMRDRGVTVNEIARRFGCIQQNVSAITNAISDADGPEYYEWRTKS